VPFTPCFTGQKGSDVTAREATRKMVAAATQLDALQQIVMRIDAIAAEHNVPLVHMARPGSAGTTAGAAAAQHHAHGHHGMPSLQEDAAKDEHSLVPRSAAAVVQPNMWQPKNTIVRSAYREVSSLVVAQRAAGPLAAAAAVAPVAPAPMVQSMAAAAAAAAAGGGSAAATSSAAGGSGSPAVKTVASILRPVSASAIPSAPPGSWSPAGSLSTPGGAAAAHRDTSCLGAGVRSTSSSHNGTNIPTCSLSHGGFSSPAAHRGTSSSGGGGGGGRHSQPETPINNPVMVLQEGAAPEDTLMAAVQQLSEAQTPRRGGMYTPRRAGRRGSTGGS
jgi:hypothetical protein